MKKTKTQNKGTTWTTCRRCGAKAAGFVIYQGAPICLGCYNEFCYPRKKK